MNPRVVCPKCGLHQFVVPKKMIRDAQSPNHLLELMTAAMPKAKRKLFKWGQCKAAGCDGKWWEPRGFKGWISIQVPTAMLNRKPEPAVNPRAEDFE